jgi:site-specific recombinase XerD
MASRRSFPFVTSRRRSDGTIAYRGYVDVGKGVAKKRRFTDTFDAPDDAYAARQSMASEAENCAPADSLFEAIEQLRGELRTKRTRGTLRWYEDHLRAVCRLIPGENGLHRITPETIEQFIRDRLARPTDEDGKPKGRKVTPATVNADLRALHRVFALAIRRSVVKTNPVAHVDRPRADVPAMDWFRDDELGGVLPTFPTQRHRDVVQLFAMTGVRRSEAARLEPGHLRTKLRQLVVPGKTRTRVVPLAPDLDAPCARLLAAASADRLLPGDVHAIDVLFREAREACGDRRMHPHAMRHTFCTWLVRRGVQLHVVMRLADHRDIKTTMRYVHEVGDESLDAVARLRLARHDESGPAAQA